MKRAMMHNFHRLIVSSSWAVKGATVAENRDSIYNFVSFIRKTIKRAARSSGANALVPIAKGG